MKKIVSIIIILSLSQLSYSQQDFTGEAIYVAQYKQDVKVDSSSLTSNPLKNSLLLSLTENMKSGIQQTYVLKFDKTTSLYKREEKLELPQASGVRVSADIGFSGDKLYKNLKEGRFSIENEIYGKKFIIKDTLEKHNWKLENETKKIGAHTCYKATKTYKKRVIDNRTLSFSVHKTEEDKVDKTKWKEIDIIVTAWYTPEIPVSMGPGIYHGLPGLILEVGNGTEIIICNKVTLNPEKRIKIKEPKNGDVVNQTEFDEILKTKQKENKERARG